MILNRAESRLYPLVYVPSAGTLFWENSCASGTTAVGAFLAAESGKAIEITLQQPGGNLTIAASETGDLLLSGTVRIRRHAVF
jgi:diaminopimelate epimerase